MEDNAEQDPDDRQGMANPLLWGFLSTVLLALAGYIGFRVGIIAFLWLPLFTPVLALAYMRRSLHSFRGFERYLFGYMAALLAITLTGIFLLALVT